MAAHRLSRRLHLLYIYLNAERRISPAWLSFVQNWQALNPKLFFIWCFCRFVVHRRGWQWIATQIRLELDLLNWLLSNQLLTNLLVWLRKRFESILRSADNELSIRFGSRVFNNESFKAVLCFDCFLSIFSTCYVIAPFAQRLKHRHVLFVAFLDEKFCSSSQGLPWRGLV